jgi:hypothetical protein
MKILPTILTDLFKVNHTSHQRCPLCDEYLIQGTYIPTECGACRTESRPFSLGSSEEACCCEDRREKCLKCPQCYDKIYIFVPFKEKNIAKERGCRWDGDRRRWYFKWNPANRDGAVEILKRFGTRRIKLWLDVDYEKKDKAKRLGCRWDNDKGLWYYENNPFNNKPIPNFRVIEREDIYASSS